MPNPAIGRAIEATWALTALVVLGYPMVAGRMRSGRTVVDRQADPSAFWRSYALSSALFVVISAVAFYALRDKVL